MISLLQLSKKPVSENNPFTWIVKCSLQLLPTRKPTFFQIMIISILTSKHYDLYLVQKTPVSQQQIHHHSCSHHVAHHVEHLTVKSRNKQSKLAKSLTFQYRGTVFVPCLYIEMWKIIQNIFHRSMNHKNSKVPKQQSHKH